MIDLLVHLLLLIGAAFILIAALGVLRFPDVLARMHAVSKATSFGLGCMLLALLVKFPSLAVFVKVAVAIVFVFLTLPVATHLIARATRT
jgi:multicomponent Na+:H+ antiporter subunit G